MQPFQALIALVALTASCHVMAQKANVFVEVEAADGVGGRLGYAIKEGIRRSAGLNLVDRPQDGFWGLSLLTLDPDKQAQRTAYSLVWTTRIGNSSPSYIRHKVGICGSTRLTECADEIVAETDKAASDYTRAFLDVIERALQKPQ